MDYNPIRKTDEEPRLHSKSDYAEATGVATWLTEEEMVVYADFDKTVAKLIMHGDEEIGTLSDEMIKELKSFNDGKISWHGVMSNVVCKYISRYYFQEGTRKDLLNGFFTDDRLKRFAIVGLLSAISEGYLSLTMGTNNIKGQVTFTTKGSFQGEKVEEWCRGGSIVATIVAQCKVLRTDHLEFIKSLDLDYSSDATAVQFETVLLNSTINSEG